MVIVRKIILLLLALSGFSSVRAQQFSYTVSCDSSGTYQELTAQTLLNPGGGAWAQTYRVPLGFAFSFLGNTFDSVTVERNGYLSFDSDRRYALMVYNAFRDKTDSTNNHSTLGYALSGTAGSRILKLQYKNVGATRNKKELFSYQIWLKENGSIEVHVGPHTYPVAASNNYTDTLNANHIGLLNTNMDTETRGLFLKGSPTQPASQPVNDSYPDLPYLRSYGEEGTTYSFIPQQ